MTNKRITELTALDGDDVANDDVLVIVDVSDTTMAASGTNKKITVAEFATDSTLGGAFVAKSTLTTDGDMLTRASGVPDRITRADLAQDSAFSSRYAPHEQGTRSGWWITGRNTRAVVAPLADRATGHLITINRTITLNRIGCSVSVAGAAGNTMRLGIYNAGTDIMPSTLVLDAGTVATDTTGFKEITISQVLDPGTYWLVGAPSIGATATFDGLVGGGPPFQGFSTGQIFDNRTGVTSGTSQGAALDASYTLSSYSNACPHIVVRVA